MKLVRLIKMCLNETYSTVWVGKHLCDMFPIQEVGLGYEDWIGLAQDRDRWRVLVSAGSIKRGEFLDQLQTS